MYRNKRSSEFHEVLSVETKKIRPKSDVDRHRIYCIEDLSNELFYDLFEYLEGINIYKAFSKLNTRFNNLIMNSSLPLKMNIDSSSKLEIEEYCNNMIIPSRHRIISLRFQNESLINDFFLHCIIDSSFDRLQSITLDEISYDKLIILFFYLKSLPQLFSLTIRINGDCGSSLSALYRMVFSLPVLKYNNLFLISNFDEEYSISVPLAANEKLGNIEYLIINHSCAWDDLFSMLRHTPKLRHLSCEILLESSTNINAIRPLVLPNLIYLNLSDCQLGFDEFEIFITKLSAPLNVLSIKQWMGEDYLVGDRWEELIKTYLPNLCTFNYEYHQSLTPDEADILLYTNFESFNSLFWIERQYFSGVKIIDDDLIYAVHLYRKSCSDIYKHQEIATQFNQNLTFDSHSSSTIFGRQDANKSFLQVTPPIQLSISGVPSKEQDQLIIEKFKSMLAAVQFTRLDIDCRNIPITMLAQIIHVLPNLDSLKLSYLPIIHQDWLFDNDSYIYYLTSTRNKITKVNVENILDIEQVNFVIYICNHIQYLQINVPETMDLKGLVRFILMQATMYTPQLRLLCLTIHNTDEEAVHQLQMMINTENLLVNYIIRRISNHIVLEWNQSSQWRNH